MGKSKEIGRYNTKAGSLDIEKVIKDAQELLTLLLGASHVYLRDVVSDDEATELIKGVQQRLEELCEDVIDERGDLIGPPVFAGAVALVLHRILEEEKVDKPMILIGTKEPLDC
jgi:hypothetical protein